MDRPRTYLSISKPALVSNFQEIQKLLGSSELIPVIKANAYGHGLCLTAEILVKAGASIFAVNDLEEAILLRQAGFTQRILVVGPLQPSHLEAGWEAKVELTLSEPQTLEAFLTMKKRPKVHIKFDTGMHRQGFLPSEAQKIKQLLAPCQESIVGISSHFANVEDVLAQDYALYQLDQFAGVLEVFHDWPLTHHIASSASALILPKSHYDWARVGIALYGLWPSHATKLSFRDVHGGSLALKPVLSWHTKVAQVKEVKKDGYIGYGCTYRALRPMRLAVLPVGYYEGYPRLAGGHGAYVLIKGQRCPIVGRICMNMMMIDVSHLSSCQPSELATLIGEDGNEVLPAGLVAEWAETIHYELVTKIAPHLPRLIH